MPPTEVIVAIIAVGISIIALASSMGSTTSESTVLSLHECPADASCEVLSSGEDVVYMNISSDPAVDAIYISVE